jgi:hypothetical protein
MGCESSANKLNANLNYFEFINEGKSHASLFVRVMKYDFNWDSDLDNSFESSFTRAHTNDLGETILPQTAHILICEFKYSSSQFFIFIIKIINLILKN